MTKRREQQKLFDHLVAIRRVLHENPELSMEEYETTKRIQHWLQEAQISLIDYPSLKSGVIAEIKGEQEGPTIAIRADIDALPVQEKTDLSFASKSPGKMHACGHDFHTASMIGAAILLKERQHELKGNVRFVFQPGEETAVGAKHLVDAGVLEGVSAIFGMHNKPELPVGTIGVRQGALMASVDRFEIDVIGVGGHAGIPNKSVDPIVTASQIVSGLQSVLSRNISSMQNAVISVCKFHSGTAWNVIPNKVEIEGTVRTFQAEARAEIPNHMKRIAEGIAAAYGAAIDFRWFPYLPMVNNDGRFAALVTETAAELGYHVVEAEQTFGGEDFSIYQLQVPGFYIWMGISGTEEWHHSAFTLDEESLLVSAQYFSHLAIKLLERWHNK